MAEIKGYFLSEEEAKACVDLVKKLRERKTFAINFSGCIRIKAKTLEEANSIFWEWAEDLQNKSLADWSGVVTQSPYFKNEGTEKRGRP